MGQQGAYAQTAGRPPLKFFKNYFLTGGDYAVGGIGLRGQGDKATQLATGAISMSGVPAGADISAAFLYWITLEPKDGPDSMSNVAYFRGQQVTGKLLNPAVNVPGCWGSGGGGATSQVTTARVYRADVLRNLPLARNPATPGRFLVNETDLITDNAITSPLPQNSITHQVQLRDSGGGGTQAPSSGNQVSYAEGAGLVVVYRIPDFATPSASNNLRSVVIYDGAVTADANEPIFNLTISGFYQASATPGARMTHLVGNGDTSFQEKLTIGTGTTATTATNPFFGSSGAAWDNPSYSVPVAEDAASTATKVQPIVSSVDCLEWGAVIFSTEVKDADRDGIVDAVENANPALSDPNGQSLPNLKLMGGGSDKPDLFVEIGYMKNSTPWTDLSNGSTVGLHSHLPSYEALWLTGNAFKNAGIRAHFDVGANYQSAAQLADGYIISTAQGAMGGEEIAEKACGADGNTLCQFKNYPGTVGWKSGYQYFRDAPVNSDVTGSEMTAAQETACETNGGCRRRFDSNRFDIFHYSLWAHALGLVRAADQCPSGATVINGVCTDSGGSAIPGRSSGFGDLGGGDTLITLAAFGNNFNAAPVTQAGTFMHELGHNADRKHGGYGLERNCKPNYISVMSYLFQVHGIWMLNTQGQRILGVDFSGQTLGQLNETSLTDDPLAEVSGSVITPAFYPTRWYAPPTFVQTTLGLTPALKHCDGTLKSSTETMVRVDGVSATDAIDWNLDGTLSSTAQTQDINFNGGPRTGVASDGPFAGTNDWQYILQSGLNQIASRPNMGALSLDVGTSDLGRGDPGAGLPGRGDPGRGDPGRGDPGRGDPGRGDPGRGDPGRGDPGAPPGDLDIATAASHVQAPPALTPTKELKTVRLTWQPSFIRPEGVTVTNTIYRVEGTSITPANFAKRVLIAQNVTGTTTVDSKPLNGKPVIYILFEVLSNGTKSDFVTAPFTYK